MPVTRERRFTAAKYIPPPTYVHDLHNPDYNLFVVVCVRLVLADYTVYLYKAVHFLSLVPTYLEYSVTCCDVLTSIRWNQHLDHAEFDCVMRHKLCSIPLHHLRCQASHSSRARQCLRTSHHGASWARDILHYLTRSGKITYSAVI